VERWAELNRRSMSGCCCCCHACLSAIAGGLQSSQLFPDDPKPDVPCASLL
jgi:hypothetical protein